ncbi:hypothetical protein D3248_01840 [Leucobacter zeae]|nr:hypothetical protein [Leucobacter zeae]
MNTTLSAAQASASQHLHTPRSGHDHLSVELPAGDALRRLPLSSRIRLRAAIWLLERTPVASAPAIAVAVAPTEAHAATSREQAAAGREALVAYEAVRLARTTAPRAL